MTSLKPEESATKLSNDLKWIKLPSESVGTIQESDIEEKPDKYKYQRIILNSCIAIGTLSTITALSLGLRSLMKNDKKRQQLMMRYRVGAQALTVLAVVASICILNKKNEN